MFKSLYKFIKAYRTESTNTCQSAQTHVKQMGLGGPISKFSSKSTQKQLDYKWEGLGPSGPNGSPKVIWLGSIASIPT